MLLLCKLTGAKDIRNALRLHWEYRIGRWKYEEANKESRVTTIEF